MVFLCVILSLFVLFGSVTETLGSEEILDDMLDEISAIKRDMNNMKNDIDKMKNDFDERKGNLDEMKSDLDEMMDSRLDKLLRQVEKLRDIHLTPKTTILTSPTLSPTTTTPTPPTSPTLPLPPQPSACSSYTELSDAWRHIDYVNRGNSMNFPDHCDSTGSSSYYTYTNLGWGSWFRFTGAAGNKLPTAPAPVGGGPRHGNHMCGTNAVAYISSGGNPTIQDGIVTRDVCFEWRSNSCHGKTTVGVAACRDIHGEYFVYQLQPAPVCYYAYCAID